MIPHWLLTIGHSLPVKKELKKQERENKTLRREADDMMSQNMRSISICTSVVSRAFMAGAASHAGDADSSRAPGLTSGLQGSVNVHRGALLLVPQ